MEILTPFVVPIAVFDMQEHVQTARDLCAQARNEGRFAVGSGGFWTTLSDDYEGDTDSSLLDKTDPFRLALNSAVLAFADKLGYATAAYEPEVSNFWLNEMPARTSHGMHSHYGKHFSGCFYIDVPQGAGNIVFSSFRARFDAPTLTVAQYTQYNAGTWAFVPKEGQLYLWESWLQHTVPPADFVGLRRTAALDVVLRKRNRGK